MCALEFAGPTTFWPAATTRIRLGSPTMMQEAIVLLISGSQGWNPGGNLERLLAR